MRKRKGVKFEV